MSHLSVLHMSRTLRKIESAASIPLAWHFFAKIGGPAVLVGMVTLHHLSVKKFTCEIFYVNQHAYNNHKNLHHAKLSHNVAVLTENVLTSC